MDTVRVLYLEDDAGDRELTRRHLERHAPHMKLTMAETVAEALERLTVGDVDLVLSDYRLPDGTGLELLEAIKSRGVNVPVVLVTGSGGVDTAVQLLKAGAADYVVKRSNYLTTLPQIIDGAFRWFQSVREARGSSICVLYAEHDPADVELTRRALTEEGPHFQLHVAARGEDALQMLRTLRYDVLLLDYRLPDLSGIELLKALREEGIRVPALMLTGHGDEDTAVQAFKLGAADYIVKRQGYLAKLPSTLENVLAQRRLADEKEALLILNGLTKSIASFQSVDELAQRVARAAADLLRVETSVLWFVDGLRLRPAGLAGVEPSLGPLLEGRVEPWFFERPAGERTVRVSDLGLVGREPAGEEAVSGRLGGLAVTVMKGPQVVGVLSVMTRRPREFTTVETRLLTTLADHAAIAIDNAVLYRRVTEQLEDLRRAQAQLLQTEKVAAMGQLLAGVAHELNNPLAVLVGHAALLQRTVGHPSVQERATKITDAAERCTRIVRNFLALARQRPPEREAVALNEVVRQAVELLAYQLRVDEIGVTFDLAAGLPKVWADPNQLHQVLINLITNAHHVMRRTSPPRRLTLRSRFDTGRAQATLEVADSGPGVPPEIQTQIFEPFFTTKPVGEGTGLGLSLCRSLVEAHGGTIRVESAVPHGAVFVIDLPIHEPGKFGAAAGPTAGRAQPIPGKAILVVDDEPEVAAVLAEMLRSDGHRVDTAGSGALALAKLRDNSYDLIVSDVRMPDLDGPGLYRELERSFPALARRLIFVTGDVLSHEISALLQKTGVVELSKPFTLDAIRHAIRHSLEVDSPSPDR